MSILELSLCQLFVQISSYYLQIFHVPPSYCCAASLRGSSIWRTSSNMEWDKTVQRWKDYPTPQIDQNVANSGNPRRRVTAEAQRAWLERSKNWPDLDPAQTGTGRRWSPRKVLGVGGFGIVGLWAYLGRDPDQDDGSEDLTPQRIAIKQGSGLGARLQMQWESKLLLQIMGAETDHVVKIYKGFHLDGGTGADARRDPIPFDVNNNYDASMEVCRMYLEYCENGDMHELLLHRLNKNEYTIPEEQVWRMFLCLFKALLVLESGNETPGPALWDQPIAHFDIKPSNILIGSRDALAHQRLEVFKLTDFGMAQPMPRDPAEWGRNPWIASVEQRATPKYRPPEQYFQVQNLITWKTGIWSAAASIFSVVSGHYIEPRMVSRHPRSGELCTCSPNILFDRAIFPYSESLINLFCSCLKIEPEKRPEISGIVHEAQQRVDYYDQLNAANNVPADLDALWSGTEPNLTIVHAWPMPQIFHLGPDQLPDRAFMGMKRSERYMPGPSAPDARPLFFGTTERPVYRKLAEYPFLPLYNVH